MDQRKTKLVNMSHELILTTKTAHYPVVVGAGILASLPERLASLDMHGTLWLVSDSAVYPHHGEWVQTLLRESGYTVQTHIVASGEESKSEHCLWDLYTWMLRNGVERRDTVLALGGGVVGDLAGFAAATILRGIAVVQLPTTLLAMVDASIGGKTGINHAVGKNLIGAFHQPRLVLADTETLITLPQRELCAGWAEVIKHGVIRDAGLFEWLESYAAQGDLAKAFAELSPAMCASIGDIIRCAAAVKVAVVSEDEREQGLRAILNYGHTIGHALEAATSYGTLLHGEAVAMGMHVAARIAATIEMLAWEDVERQQRLLHAYGLSTTLPESVDGEQLLALTLHDKKVHNKRVRWIMPTAIGSVAIRDDIPESVVRQVLTT